MNYDQVLAHLLTNYSKAEEGAAFLVETLYHRRRLISKETAESIEQVLNRPICTGVRFGDLAPRGLEIMMERYKRTTQ